MPHAAQVELLDIVANPGRQPGGAAPPPGGSPARDFHRRLPGYRPGPLIDAPGLAAELGLARVVVKDESSRFDLPSYKVLGAAWATYRALIERLGHPADWTSLAELRAVLAPLGPLRLAAATDGNHGRAVARVASWLGYPARILVPAGTAAARVQAIRDEGAQVEVVPGSYDDAVEVTTGLMNDSTLVVSDTSWSGYVDIPRWTVEGYSTIWAEADEQLGGAVPDLVVVQMGVGSLAASVVRAYAARSRVVVVENTAAPCGLLSAAAGRPVVVPGPHRSIMAGLNCGTASPDAWPELAAGVDVFLTVADHETERAMCELASAGVTAGETGAAGFAGLSALIDRRDRHDLALAGRTAMVICTEGATDPQAYVRITSARATA